MIRQLATLLDSGLPLLVSLQAMSHEKSHGMIRDAMKGMSQLISEGGQLSDALAKYPAIFPALFVRLARIGEQAGNVSAVLRRGASYLESQSELKAKLRASMTYPAIVAVTAGISVIILIKFSIPMLSGLLDEFGADLPFITKVILGLSDFVSAFGPWILLLFIFTIGVGFLYRRRPNGRLAVDRMLLRLPLFGVLIQRSSVARVTQTLASLLASGIPLLEAVELTMDSTDNAVLKQALDRARLELLAGNNFSDALRLNPIFPPMVVEVVRVGETAGNLTDQLDVISRVLQQDFDASVSRLVGIIEPAMILGVGAVVAIIGVTVITTVYSILPSIGSD